MPLFGKRKGDMTPEEQAAARQRRRELLETIGATMSDMANPGGGAFSALQARRDRLMQEQKAEAQRQQMLSSFNDLIGQIQPTDTMTPQVNQLIGAANETGSRFDMAPMDRMAPRPSGLDLQNPKTRAALTSYLGAGGSIDAPFALADRVAPPPPNMSLFNTRSGVVGINPQTGETQQLYSDRYAEALAEQQIAAQRALAGQRSAAGQAAAVRANAALINANRPRATGDGARPGAGPSIDQPWTLFKQ